jgi:hypothetical protein
MCNKGGSPPVPNQTSTAYQSATAPSAFVQPYYQNFIANASNLAQTPFNPAMYGQVAPMNATQQQAGAMLTSDIPGAVTNLMDVGRGMGTFDPARIREIESPYTEDVVTATQNWFNNQNAIQGNDLISQAIRTGNAFGGDRAGIAQAQLAGQQQLAQAPVIAGLRQAGYTQALDEYNRLKTMGLTGAQAALQAPVMGAGALMGWGGMQQQQQQKEMDVAQQNAMMASAYPFQTQNWYGSTLGGMGPLLGSFAQGYTTPPQPNELTQGLGIASSLIGLGTSLFGKHGGPVERKTGGLVPIVVPRRHAGGTVRYPRLQIGGLVYIPRRQYGGGINLDVGASDDDDDRKTTTSFNLDQLNVPSFKAPPEAGKWMEQRMRDTARQRRKQDDNPTASAIDTIAGLAKKAAPLMALALLKGGGPVITLKRVRGGPIRRYADGDSVDDDEDTDDTDTDTDTEDTSIPATAALRTGPGPDTMIATPAVAARAVPMGAPEGGSPAGPPVQAADLPPETRDAYAQAGAGAPAYGRVRAPSTQVIPGLGPEPRSFAQRWAVNPFTAAGAAMLQSRSPYFGAGLGAGLTAAAGAVERGRREELLDQKPQMLTDGETIRYRVGNKIIDTGLRSPSAGKQSERMAIEKMKEEGRMERQKMRGQGKPSAAQEEATNRAHIRNIERGIKDRLGSNVTATPEERAEAARAVIQEYNDRYGTSFKVPAGKPPAEEATPGAPQGEGWWNWFRRALTGASAPAKPAEAAPAAPAALAAPAETAPAAPAAKPAAPAAAPAAEAPAAEAPQDLGGAIKSGKVTEQQAIAQARAAAKRDPSKIDMITERLRKAGIKNFGDLLSGTPATPAQ